MKKQLTPILKVIKKLLTNKSGQTIKITPNSIEMNNLYQYLSFAINTGLTEEIFVDGKEFYTAVRHAEKDLKLSATFSDLIVADTSVPLKTKYDFVDKIVPSNNKKSLFINNGEFRSALQYVEHAQADDKTKEYVMSVCLNFVNGVLNVVATDGFRLARWAMSGTFDIPNCDVIIPTAAVSALIELSGKNVNFEIFFDNSEKPSVNGLMIFDGSFELITRVSTGIYPNWRNVNPINPTFELTMNRDELLNAMKELVTQDTLKRIEFIFSENSVELTVDNSSRKTIRLNNTTNFTGKRKFNGYLFIDALNAFPANCEEVVIKQKNDQFSSVIITMNDYPGTALLMPIWTRKV